MKYGDLTKTIIGCAMKVHSHFGIGFPEVVYQRSLAIELEKANLAYSCEVEKDIRYAGQLVGKRRLDLIVEGKNSG